MTDPIDRVALRLEKLEEDLARNGKVEHPPDSPSTAATSRGDL